jgi:hypothetical protein
MNRNIVTHFLSIFFGIFLFIVLVGSAFYLNRWMNWKMSYASMVDRDIKAAMANHIQQYHGEKK